MHLWKLMIYPQGRGVNSYYVYYVELFSPELIWTPYVKDLVMKAKCFGFTGGTSP